MALADRLFLRGILLLTLRSVLVLVLFGCAGRPAAIPPVSDRSYASPEAAIRAISVPSPAAAVTATARIQISHNGERHSQKVALMMRMPSFLRVESIPLMGPPDFLLSMANGELRVFLASQEGGTFYIGRATPQNLSRFIPLPLPPNEVVSLLMGGGWLPGNDGNPPFSFRGEQEERFYRVDQYVAGRIVRSIWIDPPADFLVRLRKFTESGGISYTADFSEPTRVGKEILPQSIVLSGNAFPGLTIRYSNLQKITDDNTTDFPLAVPEGAIPVSLDESKMN